MVLCGVMGETNRLQGKVAIVTGGTKGIGRALAELLLREGARVVICSRHQEEIERVVAELETADTERRGEISGCRCDVRDPEAVKRLIAFAVERYGGLDILVNNAGVGHFQNVEEMDVETWRTVIATNLDSLFYTCHCAIPELKKRGGGFIVNIGSLAGKNAFPGGAAYNASKFGLVGFSEALMQEVRFDNIRVAYIMPGSVDTWFGGRPPEGESSWKLSPYDVAQVVVDILRHPERCLVSRVEMRPSQPPRKG
ncbi:MAG: SDR family oxidoreductase [Acidobacteriota bacterium]